MKEIMALLLWMTYSLSGCGLSNGHGYLKVVKTTKRCVPENSKFLVPYLKWELTYQCYSKDENTLTGNPGKTKDLDRQEFYGGCHVSSRSVSDSFLKFTGSDQNDFTKACDVNTESGDKYKITAVQNGVAQVFKVSTDGTETLIESLKCTDQISEEEVTDKDSRGCINQNPPSLAPAKHKGTTNPKSCHPNDRAVEFYGFPDEANSSLDTWCRRGGGALTDYLISEYENAGCISPSKNFAGAALIDWLKDNGLVSEQTCESLLKNIEL